MKLPKIKQFRLDRIREVFYSVTAALWIGFWGMVFLPLIILDKFLEIREKERKFRGVEK